MFKQSVLILILGVSFFSTFCKFPVLNKKTAKKVVLIQMIESKNSFISYVRIGQKLFLVKQKKDINKQISVIRDTLAAYVALGLDVAHQVAIIPNNMKFPGKVRDDWPATLHTIAPGDTVRRQRQLVFYDLNVKQWWAGVKTFSQRGLTREIINHMSWHEQLPYIMALDLVTNNSDRHNGNIMYDVATDRFCAIDMDDTFNKDLCAIAYKKLCVFMEDPGVPFSDKELAALYRLKKVMAYILKKHKPAKIIKKMNSFAKQAGFYPGAVTYTPSVERKLAYYATIIEKTWVSADKVITAIENLLRKYGYKTTKENKQEEDGAHDS